MNPVIHNILKAFLLTLIFFSLCGCGLTRQALATLQSTSHFLVLDSDNRILYEAGAEDISKELAGYLNDSINKVEKEQYSPFPKPVHIYICATNDCFSIFTGLPAETKGATTIKHVFISAERLRALTPGNRRAVLTHELSHLHLQQHLGTYKHGSNLPAWFQEGLAEYVSGGASEGVTDAEAKKAILDGKHFKPVTTGNFFFPKKWKASGLKSNMFYRQSFLFVSYLGRTGQSEFRTFVLALEHGNNFETSFNTTFGFTMDVAWQQFVSQIRAQ